MTPEELQRLERVEQIVASLMNAAQADPDIVQALGDLLGSGLKTSSKLAASENVTVNEAGSSVHSVLGAPSGFKQDAEGNNFPYY